MSGLGVTSTVRAMLASPSPGCWSADAIWRGVPQAAGYGIRQGVAGRRATRTRMTTSEARRVECRVHCPALDIGEGERGMRERETRAGEELSSRVRVDKVKKSLGPEG